jgi:hypothetical protein
MKRKVAAEQYFTSAELARRCVDSVAARFTLAEFDLVVEPSAGEGAFFELLPSDKRIGIDILPQHPGLIEADFLAWQPPATAGRILTIGNPPFGQRAALAFDFLAHAAAFSDMIAFILPRSFNKYTFINRVPRQFHLVDSFNCHEFTDVSGRPVNVKAVFQIWQRQTVLRELIQLPDSHPDFDMRHAHLSRTSAAELARLRSNYEFAIPQVGANFRPRDLTLITKGSHWFIKPNVPGVRDRFAKMDFGFLDGMNTAHKSLSKRDIVAAYVGVQ